MQRAVATLNLIRTATKILACEAAPPKGADLQVRTHRKQNFVSHGRGPEMTGMERAVDRRAMYWESVHLEAGSMAFKAWMVLLFESDVLYRETIGFCFVG